jgi:hypothetical protein
MTVELIGKLLEGCLNDNSVVSKLNYINRSYIEYTVIFAVQISRYPAKLQFQL